MIGIRGDRLGGDRLQGEADQGVALEQDDVWLDTGFLQDGGEQHRRVHARTEAFVKDHIGGADLLAIGFE